MVLWRGHPYKRRRAAQGTKTVGLTELARTFGFAAVSKVHSFSRVSKAYTFTR